MTNVIDDSALLHYSKGYNPEYARQYYLRNRKLKGRQGPQEDFLTNSRKEFKRHATGNEGTYARPPSNAKVSSSKRKKVLEQKEALEKRLERLEEVLAQLVEAAKKRSGVETESKESKTKPENDKPDKKLTTAEKREKAKDARENYEPEPTVNQEVKQLQNQIQDVLSQIKAAAADAQRQRSGQSNTEAALVRR